MKKLFTYLSTNGQAIIGIVVCLLLFICSLALLEELIKSIK